MTSTRSDGSPIRDKASQALLQHHGIPVRESNPSSAQLLFEWAIRDFLPGQHVLIQNQRAAGNLAKRWFRVGFKSAMQTPVLPGSRPDTPTGHRLMFHQ